MVKIKSINDVNVSGLDRPNTEATLINNISHDTKLSFFNVLFNAPSKMISFYM